MCKVSIIVPIYKVEQYLESCLESIRNQTFADYEVIMVDDGSPDGSAEICRRYAELDSRFSLIQQVNSGVTAARRAGVGVSSGEYIFFVDGDDSLPENALHTLISRASDDFDIIVGQPNCAPLVTSEAIVNCDEYRQKLIYGKLYLAMWGRLYRRTLFDGFTFNMSREIISGEDWIANLRLAFNTSKKVLLLPDVVYNYDMRPTGVSATIKRTVEHEKMVYEALLNSVPESGKSVYFPMIAHAYTPIWVKYTKRMVKLSQVAESFRKSLLTHLRASSLSMSLKDSLFLKCQSLLVRLVLVCVSCVVGWMYGFVNKY